VTSWLSNIGGIIWTILTGWIRGLVAYIRRLCGLLRLSCDRRRLPGRADRTADSRCVPLKHPAYHKPDPLIYDQYYLMNLGLAVTWDNPDIELLRNGVRVPSSAIQPNTEYEIVARIWNGSTSAPIVGMEVHFSYLSFGIGTTSHPIGVTTVDLGVKGGPGCPTFARIPWRTPATAGHYCIQVAFDWLDDANPLNNLGQENLTVVTAHSPADIAFPVRNTQRTRRVLQFQVDTYQLPQQLPCGDIKRPSRRELLRRSVLPVNDQLYPNLPEQIRARHDRDAYPLPDGWRVEFSPTRLALDPSQEAMVRATIVPTSGFTGRQRVNIRAVDGAFVAGGITIEVAAG
jgi:hypothetical protein